MTKRVFNFYAGPATLPLPALKKAQKELIDFQGAGMSLMEISHRSKEYAAVHSEASNLVRTLMKIPEDYKILWLQGGASTQFYLVPLNLKLRDKPFEYLIDLGNPCFLMDGVHFSPHGYKVLAGAIGDMLKIEP